MSHNTHPVVGPLSNGCKVISLELVADERWQVPFVIWILLCGCIFPKGGPIKCGLLTLLPHGRFLSIEVVK